MDSQDNQLLDIFSRNESRVKRYFAGMSLSREDCEDLTQETWIKFARNGIAAFAAPVPYLMRIARTLAIDHDRTVKRRLTSNEVDALLQVPDRGPGPESDAEYRDQLLRLKAIMDMLPERRRAILLASRIEERKHSEIAREFGVTVRTIEMELRKAVEHCREQLDALNKI